MNILKLTLKKGWFDMVLSGEKYEEYREIKPYWIKRLLSNIEHLTSLSDIEAVGARFKKFDCIEFTNGYSKSSPMVTKECQGIDIAVGLYILGAPNIPVFRIKLGKEVCRLNC
jgi:hypothetical protein